MQPIRVLLIDMPRMMREMFVRALARDDRFALVGESSGDIALELAVDRSGADYILQGRGVLEQPEAPDEGLKVRVLTVEAGRGRAVLHELRPQGIPLGDLPPEQVLERMAQERSCEAGER